jgi:hypothetical protein
MSAYDYDSIVALGEELNRPAGTLVAQIPASDPFFARRPGRQQSAEWFADLWRRFEFGPGTHLRRVHYILVSQDSPIICPDGADYENTSICWHRLISASRDARYLDLVPVEHFEDRRNDDVTRHLFTDECDGDLSIEEPSTLYESELQASLLTGYLPEPPDFQFSPATVDQHYHVELWCEKTTMNDVLLSLAREYDLNVVTGSGEISVTHCYALVRRAKETGRPVRILYVSDFDPAGQSIPVACARKIEFFIRRDDLDLDVQVRPVALTHEQCIDYELPRTPLKETETRAARFEERFGDGATELDALEALHPGELHRILEQEILRYFDTRLDDRVQDEAESFRHELGAVREEIIERHSAERDAIEKTYRKLVGEINPEVKAIIDKYTRRHRAIVNRFRKLQEAIREELEAEAPDVGSINWPEPEQRDEDGDPLFDSNRGYVEQIDRFKLHQGKRTERKIRNDKGKRRSAETAE